MICPIYTNIPAPCPYIQLNSISILFPSSLDPCISTSFSQYIPISNNIAVADCPT